MRLYVRALTVSKFGSSKADFRSRTCGAVRRPQDVRHAQLAALPALKFENSPVPCLLSSLTQKSILSSIKPLLSRHPAVL